MGDNDRITDAADYELQPEPASPVAGPPRPRSAAPVIAGVAALVIAAAALIWFLRQPSEPAAEPAGELATTAAVPAAPLGADVEPIDLPPLGQTDPLVRDLVKALSSHPRIAAWLATDGLIRSFTITTDTIAAGRSPARYLSVLKPARPFAAISTGEYSAIDVRSYDRYNDIAAAAASIDPAGAARLYSLLKPRINDAYAELAGAGAFDPILERAIVVLLETPAVGGDLALLPRGGLFQFNDPRLEQLSPAQKHLVRMGPRNTRTIQRALRNIAHELGITPDRLPAR